MNGKLETIPLNKITLTKHNPRKINPDDPAIIELAESIKKCGLLQPVVCRPIQNGGYELLAGARRYHAHVSLGLYEILATVHELDDRQAIEVTVLENLQREDLTPIEEGRGVRELLDSGHDPKEIAANIGKHVNWVYRRAQLSKLVPEVLKRIADDEKWAKASAAHLELLARLPAERQIALVKANDWDFDLDAPVSEVEARLAQDEMLIAKAPWGEGGACKNCPRRSDVAPELFVSDNEPLLSHKARCLDPDCWRSQNQAFIKQKAAELQAAHGDKLVVIGDYQFRDNNSDVKLTHNNYDVEKVKKSTPGARPALIVENNIPKLGWVKVRAGAKEAKAKQPSLELRRKAWVIKFVSDELDQTKVAPFEDNTQALAFAAVMGTIFDKSYADGNYGKTDCWTQIETLRHGEDKAAMQKLWQDGIRAVLNQRLRYSIVSNCGPQYQEALRVADLIMLENVKGLMARAEKAIPGKGK